MPKRATSPRDSFWGQPRDGRKLYAASAGKAVWAEQTADGRVVLTRAVGIPPETKPYTKPGLRAKHAMLVKDAAENEDGSYNWQGRTEPGAATTWLSAAFGQGMANIWRVLQD